MSPYPLLERIGSPADLRALDRRELRTLADELRAFLIESVSRTGGHLSSNLGTVELTIALHQVFQTPEDRIVWDVGHQTYGHKILTGRREAMAGLRHWGGISGFPRRCESEYDTFGTAHSSTSISAALGMAVAARDRGEDRREPLPPAGEDGVDEPPVRSALLRCQEGFGPPRHPQQPRVHARGRGERRRRDPGLDGEIHPGPPLRCHHARPTDPGAAPGHFPLHQEYRVGPARGVEHLAHHRRGQVKGQAPHQDVWFTGQPPPEEVFVDKVYVRCHARS